MKEQSEEVKKVYEALSAPVRLLFVDDEPADREMFAKLTEDYVCQVDTCPGGEEAMPLIDGNDYVLVVLDAHLLGMSCQELFRSIRVLNLSRGRLNRVLVTSLVFNGVARDILEDAGWIGFALKDRLLTPFFMEELMVRLGIERRKKVVDTLGESG